jgi:hypothetical protein
MDIPLFYGQTGKDTIAARLLIVRINDAGAIANWNNDCKLLEFKMCLRDKAVGWFEGLTEDGVPPTTGTPSRQNFSKLMSQNIPPRKPAPTSPT